MSRFAMVRAYALVVGFAGIVAGWGMADGPVPTPTADPAVRPQVAPVPLQGPRPKNVIVMIRDGGGFNQLEAANLYRLGRSSGRPYESFPVRLAMSTYAEGGSYDARLAWAQFAYVSSKPTDSAAAATAMSCGLKTYNAAIGVDSAKRPAKHAFEHAEEAGKATGVVSSVPFSHATPAGFVAHNVHRDNYAEIAAEMILRSRADVVMGGGHPHFDTDGAHNPASAEKAYRYVGGSATWNALAAGTAGADVDADGDGTPDPWSLVETRAQFRVLADGPTPKRVCGVAQVATTLQQARGGDAKANPFVVPLTESVPTLAEMARAALNVLDNHPDGFCLMVEGGAIDWAGHANQSGRLIEEEVGFAEALGVVTAWVEAHSSWEETLLIVTADHETGYLTGPDSGPPAVWNALAGSGAGKLPGMQWHSKGHTNSLVPLLAKGRGSEHLSAFICGTDPRRGAYVDNTAISLLVGGLVAPEATEGRTQRR